MMTFEITDSNIDTFLHEDKPQVIDFGTEWCGLCRTLIPVIEGLAAEYKGRINVDTCDAEENNALATHYTIRNVHTRRRSHGASCRHGICRDAARKVRNPAAINIFIPYQ